MKRQKCKAVWARLALLILAAILLAGGLEWVTQQTLPPIFTDTKVDFSQDPTLPERSAVYMHPSGRPALAEEWDLKRLAALFILQLTLLTLLFPLGLGRKLLAWIRQRAAALKRVLLQERARNLKLAACFAVAFLAVFFLGRIWVRDVYQRENWMVDSVCVWAGICVGCLVTFRRTLEKKPEV